MNPKLQTLYGLKFHPFRPDVPLEALYLSTCKQLDGVGGAGDQGD